MTDGDNVIPFEKGKRQRKKGRGKRVPVSMDSLALVTSPLHNYAVEIANGSIPSNAFIKQACERHLRDCERTDIYFDTDEMLAVRKFFSKRLDVSAGDGRGDIPFDLLPWQEFAICSPLCWKIKTDDDPLGRPKNTRRFRVAGIIGPKGIGKTPMWCGILVRFFFTSPLFDNNLYVTADNIDETVIPMNEIKRMLESLEDRKLINEFIGAVIAARRGPIPKSVVHHKTDKKFVYHDREGRERSTIQAVGPGQNKDGTASIRMRFALITELMNHKTGGAFDMMMNSVKANREPMLLWDSNTGPRKEGTCWHEVMTGRRALHSEPGKLGDDYFFLEYAVDDDDKPLTDPKCWIKANPSLGSHFVHKANILSTINRAFDPEKEAHCLRFQFGRWKQGLVPPFDINLWNACQVDEDDFNPHPDASLFGAIDLARNDKMTAMCKLWAYREPDAPSTKTQFWAQFHYWWTQAAVDGLSKEMKDKVEGWLNVPREKETVTICEGNIVNYDGVAAAIVDIMPKLKAFAFDPYMWNEIERRLYDSDVPFHYAWPFKKKGKRGVPLFKHPQGSAQVGNNPLWMSGSISFIQELVGTQRIKVLESFFTNWHIGSLRIAEDHLENRFYERPDGENCNDGGLALTMASGIANYIMHTRHRRSGFGFSARK